MRLASFRQPASVLRCGIQRAHKSSKRIVVESPALRWTKSFDDAPETTVGPRSYLRMLLRQYGPLTAQQLYQVTRLKPLRSSPVKSLRSLNGSTHLIQSMSHMKAVLRGAQADSDVKQLPRRIVRQMADKVGVPHGTERVKELNLEPAATEFVLMDGESYSRLAYLAQKLYEERKEKAWLLPPSEPEVVQATADTPPPSPWDFADEETNLAFLEAKRPSIFERFVANRAMQKLVKKPQLYSMLKDEASRAAGMAQRVAKGESVRAVGVPERLVRFDGGLRPVTAGDILDRVEHVIKGRRGIPTPEQTAHRSVKTVAL